MKYVKGFDTIRAFAVFCVIISHWAPTFKNQPLINAVINSIFSGQFGVNLFFVLSGFLITSILLDERAANKTKGKENGALTVRNFFIRRALRIFPIYYLAILILYVVGNSYLRQNLWYYLLYMGNILPYRTNNPNPLLHTWSLAVEEQFYLIWPWFILFLRERYLKLLFFICIIIGIVSKYVVIYVLHHGFAFLVFNQLDAFGIGGLYAYMRLNGKSKQFETRFLILLLVMMFLGWRLFMLAGSPIGVIYSRTADTFVSLAIIIFVLNNKSSILKKYLLENKYINFIGKISYGLYLYHYILGPYYEEFIQNRIFHYSTSSLFANFFYVYFLKLALLFVLCILSFIFIERPILRLKKKFE